MDKFYGEILQKLEVAINELEIEDYRKTMWENISKT